ncbi:hypothetical protein [Tanticharoenia sakaeratensis]|uniref:Uncharacterized protein n=1 Tax=Tanticharoenia sakaeratensis NBRC 103193 TaxID=1231623 RepID=A0A0D6MLQ1_9PROT|nr:hypothetical protein [Tanticharoenia sakaeratensis]GAN54604.1 hypothetical protein Tasa_025_035 [Tanticharoenia sakaeratensis NBRC 103193]GBQ22979.1 hypothetical protein AA103193_2253 [Tanticharoenia sakaeratensis NBRC 103193]
MSRPFIIACLGLVLGTSACTMSRPGHLAPLNAAARAAGGIPSLAMAQTAPHDTGLVSFALPDGTILHGHFAIVPNSTPDLLVGPDQLPQGTSAHHMFVQATNGRVTIHCDAAISPARHGGGECRSEPNGAVYDLVF